MRLHFRISDFLSAPRRCHARSQACDPPDDAPAQEARWRSAGEQPRTGRRKGEKGREHRGERSNSETSCGRDVSRLFGLCDRWMNDNAGDEGEEP